MSSSPSASRIKPTSDELALAEAIRTKIKAPDLDPDGTGQDVVEAINNLPASISAKEWARGGFGPVAGRGVTLVDRLLQRDSVNAIKRLVAENTVGLTLDDMCCVYRQPEYQSNLDQSSLACLSALDANPGGLKLALRLQPEHNDLSKMHAFGSTLATLHYSVLHHAVRCTLDQGTDGINYFNCARILQAHGAPILNHQFRGNPVGAALFGARWPQGEVSRLLAELAMSYHAAGLIDPNKPFPSSVGPCDANLPLCSTLWTGPAGAGNAAGAKALLLMGADEKRILPVGFDDLIAYARSKKLTNEDEMVSYLVSGLMERHTRSAIAAASSSTAIPRRAQRLGL